jgi:hypothetical protein
MSESSGPIATEAEIIYMMNDVAVFAARNRMTIADVGDVILNSERPRPIQDEMDVIARRLLVLPSLGWMLIRPLPEFTERAVMYVIRLLGVTRAPAA